MRSTPAFPQRHQSAIDLITPESTVSNPDPDTFYSPSQVPNYFEDPVGEVLAHSTEVIRRKINRRKTEAIAMAGIPIARAVEEPPTHAIPRDDRPKSTPTPSTTSTSTNAEPPPPATTSRDYTNLVARQQTSMRNNINSDPRNDFLEASTCRYHTCPYSVGCLMGQRFSLMQRLRQINMILYGDEEHFGE